MSLGCNCGLVGHTPQATHEEVNGIAFETTRRPDDRLLKQEAEGFYLYEVTNGEEINRQQAPEDSAYNFIPTLSKQIIVTPYVNSGHINDVGVLRMRLIRYASELYFGSRSSPDSNVPLLWVSNKSGTFRCSFSTILNKLD